MNNYLKKILEGFSFGTGLILFLGVLLGIVYAVGFHTADEILGGTFQGNYTFNGSINATGSTYGFGGISSGAMIDFNLSSCPTGWSNASLNFVSLSNSEGSIFGNMDYASSGGLSAAFDGVTSQGASVASAVATDTNGYVGKDWGVANSKTISKFLIYPPNNVGFTQHAGNLVEIRLYGSNTVPASGTDGTQLYSSGTIADQLTVWTVNSGINTDNSYLYHWIDIVSLASTLGIAEILFYEKESLKCIKD